MTQVVELSDRDSKAAMIKMLQRAITGMVKTNERIKSLSKEI